MSVAFEKLCEFTSALSSPTEIDGALYMVAQNGDIFKFKDGQLKVHSSIIYLKKSGQPSGLAIERETKSIYIADQAHQAIIMKQLDDKTNDIGQELVKDHEGMPLLGPNSLVLSLNMNSLFFTDSGPFGETSLENSKGSVYMFDLDSGQTKPLALSCLAYPSGLVLSNDEKILLAETELSDLFQQIKEYFIIGNGNKILSQSVYCQFNGRFGPTALAISQSDLLYVARFEFAQISEEGQISVLNPQGQIIENIALPNCPEISGMTFSLLKPNLLYVTENSSSPSCLRLLVSLEDKEDGKKKEKALK